MLKHYQFLTQLSQMGKLKKLREVKGQMLLWICPFPIPFVLLATPLTTEGSDNFYHF